MLLSLGMSKPYLAWLTTAVLTSSCHGSIGNASTKAFSWPSYANITYATPVPKPTTTPTYANPYSLLSTLIGNQSTTSWPAIASPTDSANPYGNAAWTSQWALYTNTSVLPFATTVSPTPIPSTELIKPPALPYATESPQTENYTFPKDFLYGFAGAALQVEGAVQAEGRGPTAMEFELVYREESLVGGGSADVTNLNYYLYKQDIARLAAVGVQTYSFSISWSRILPFGVLRSPVNQEAIDHYNDLIDTILEYGMTPMATLVHFDVPLYFATNTSVQGFDHPEFIDGFLNYGKIALTHFGDRIGHWVSFNEPGIELQILNWKSSYNVVISHAQLVHWYREVLNGTGQWTMKLSFSKGFPLPLDPSKPGDIEAAERWLDYHTGFYVNPLFRGLQAPASVVDTLGSAAPNYTDDELAYVNGTMDFLGIDLYTATYATSDGTEAIASCAADSSNTQWPYCMNTTYSRDGWNLGADSNSATYIFPQYLRTIFSYFASIPNNKGGIMVTEFGFPTWDEADMSVDILQSDIMHSTYYYSYLREMLKSINEDGINLIGAIGWSFVDNWEWGEYNDRYGVQAFNRSTLERVYKRSIFDYVDYIQSHIEKE